MSDVGMLAAKRGESPVLHGSDPFGDHLQFFNKAEKKCTVCDLLHNSIPSVCTQTRPQLGVFFCAETWLLLRARNNTGRLRPCNSWLERLLLGDSGGCTDKLLDEERLVSDDSWLTVLRCGQQWLAEQAACCSKAELLKSPV